MQSSHLFVDAKSARFSCSHRHMSYEPAVAAQTATLHPALQT